MIGSATSNGRVSITGIGSRAPERVMTNDELAQMVDTSDEWIMERTGIRERRVAAPDEAMSDLALPASLAALEQAGVKASELDLIVVATVTPDMLFPSTGAILADRLGAKDAAAYDLSAGCTGFVYAVVQAHAMVASGLADQALVVGGDVLSRSSTGRTAARASSSATVPARWCSSGCPRAVSWASSSAPTDRAGRSSTYLPEARASPRRPSRWPRASTSRR